MEKYYKHGLCHRCEKRAEFKETGRTFRFECGQEGSCVSCYGYEPVKPLVMKKSKGDKRPIFSGYMFSARVTPVGIIDGELNVSEIKRKEYVLYWKPKEKIKKTKDNK